MEADYKAKGAVKMPYPNYGIKVYKNGDYKAVNQYLRKIRGVPPTHLPNGMVLTHTQIEKLENIIRSIDSRMVSNVLSHFPVLYRGTGPDEFGKKTTDRLSSLIDGKTRRWKAYTSTSDIKRCAENYASGGNKGILLEITPSPNVSFIDLRGYSELKHTRTEPEILLARDTSYRITGTRIVNESGKHYVCLEVQLI